MCYQACFVWKGMGKDVVPMCRDCQQFHRGKVHKQPAAALHAIPVPSRRFSHGHVGLVVPIPASLEGHMYLVTAIDRSTRSVCATWRPARAKWVECFGMQAPVLSDRGTQFTSAMSTSTCMWLGIQQVLTTAYHPQRIGILEPVHRHIKDAGS
jgi:hypothetical protein